VSPKNDIPAGKSLADKIGLTNTGVGKVGKGIFDFFTSGLQSSAKHLVRVLPHQQMQIYILVVLKVGLI